MLPTKICRDVPGYQDLTIQIHDTHFMEFKERIG